MFIQGDCKAASSSGSEVWQCHAKAGVQGGTGLLDWVGTGIGVQDGTCSLNLVEVGPVTVA